MQDQKLLVFPILSSIASLIVGACFVLPMLGLHAFDGLSGGGRGISAVPYGFAFLLYLSQYFVMFFFNAALMGAAMIRMDGGISTVGDGLNIALLKAGLMQARCRPDAGPILGYALIAATVGIIFRAIQERLGFVGNLIVGAKLRRSAVS